MTATLTDQELSDRLRLALAAVAGTVTESDPERADPSPVVRPVRLSARRRRMLLGVAGVVVTLPFAAYAVFGTGSEHVDRIPPAGVIVSGTSGGVRYWMVDAFHTDACGDTFPGVEVLSDERNRPGGEWDSTGFFRGDHAANGGCGVDTSAWTDPARYDLSHVHIGDAWVTVASVDASVGSVRVTIAGSVRDVEVHQRDGAGYALIEVPEAVETVGFALLRSDGSVLPGSLRTLDRPYGGSPD